MIVSTNEALRFLIGQTLRDFYMDEDYIYQVFENAHGEKVKIKTKRGRDLIISGKGVK